MLEQTKTKSEMQRQKAKSKSKDTRKNSQQLSMKSKWSKINNIQQCTNQIMIRYLTVEKTKHISSKYKSLLTNLKTSFKPNHKYLLPTQLNQKKSHQSPKPTPLLSSPKLTSFLQFDKFVIIQLGDEVRQWGKNV